MSKQAPHIEDDLERVLDYLWKDEAADYLETSPLEDREGHIFSSLRRIRSWLDMWFGSCGDDAREGTLPYLCPLARPVTNSGALLTPCQAILRIYKIMDGTEWEPDTLDDIAEALRESGLHVSERAIR